MIIIKNDKEIDLMRIAGRIVAETLLLVEKKVKPGITTAELDRIAEEFITKHGAIPSFKGLYGFPASLCISVNEQVVHGIPGGYVLKEGDIISVDCGANINGFHGDAARTFAVVYYSTFKRNRKDVVSKMMLFHLDDAVFFDGDFHPVFDIL